MNRMNAIFTGLKRSVSEEIKAYNNHPITTTRRGISQLDAPELGTEPKLEVRTQSRAEEGLQPARSLSESSDSGSPMSGCLDSPTSAAAATTQQRKKQYKIHGMDAYDYWSLIKSL